jgi:hypothetical protein
MINNLFQVLQCKSRSFVEGPLQREEGMDMTSPVENDPTNEFELEFLSSIFGDREKVTVARALFEDPDLLDGFGF